MEIMSDIQKSISGIFLMDFSFEKKPENIELFTFLGRTNKLD